MQTSVSLDEAMRLCRTLAHSTATEQISVDHSQGRILATPVTARCNVPPFRRAMMDGFALSTDDLEAPGDILEVVGTTPAGDPPAPAIHSRQCVRVMTGAAVPDGCDAVARFEWCDLVHPQHVKILRSVARGESVQETGEDGHQGQVLLNANTRIRGQDRAVLQTFGVPQVEVFQPTRVGLLVTGSELIRDLSVPLAPGQIYGSNDILLAASLQEDGVRLSWVHYVSDDPQAIGEEITLATQNCDFLLTTGGVSKGDLDYLMRVLTDMGGQIHLNHVWMRPGSPFIGATIGDLTVFSMSGNPAACYAQFETLVRPVLRASMGWHSEPFPITAYLSHEVDLKPIKHTRVVRGTVFVQQGQLYVDTRLAQSSSVVSSFTQTNCLVRLNQSHLTAGSLVPIQLLQNSLDNNV
ncbi:molybdopterin molybdenumtransferase MoeA [Alicyclobacillaceae bacterium I2511]|nr:molybdopterin molybdenumtransferase MoeA [Alicyclobacillaceae bacterium I2511]